MHPLWKKIIIALTVLSFTAILGVSYGAYYEWKRSSYERDHDCKLLDQRFC